MRASGGICVTYLDRTKYPKYQGLDYYETRRTDAESEIYSDILANVRVHSLLPINFSPFLKPNATA